MRTRLTLQVPGSVARILTVLAISVLATTILATTVLATAVRAESAPTGSAGPVVASGVAPRAGALERAGANPASRQAQPPISLGGHRIIDPAGVLNETGRASLTAAISRLRAAHNLTLYVVYVPTFDSPTQAQAWADATADENQLGQTDYLLAVATTTRSFYLSAPRSPDIGARSLRIIDAQVAHVVRDGQWAAAGIAAADGLAHAAGTVSNQLNWSSAIPVLLIAAVLLGLVLLLLVRRRRPLPAFPAATAQTHADATRRQLAALSLGELQEHADAALNEAEATIAARAPRAPRVESAPHRRQGDLTVMATARSLLGRAKALKRNVETTAGDGSELQRREWLEQIIVLSDAAVRSLDGHSASAGPAAYTRH
ncbi:MAG: TPM domain-containing protein [Microbacteriaceae bacterium]